MTATGHKGRGKSTCCRMMDDRRTTLHILEEPQMRVEGERLRTFQHWQGDAPVTCGDLAKAGFFFLGPGDKVQCFCCGGILRYWVHGDNPAAEHKRHFPTCSFILGQAVGNIPLQAGSSDSVDGQLVSQLQRMTMDDQGTAGQAVYPEMEAEDSRLTTFHNWPTDASVQPDALTRAGFFYTGKYSAWTQSQLEWSTLCERVHATIVQLSHDVVDRKTWTKLGLLKEYSFRQYTVWALYYKTLCKPIQNGIFLPVFCDETVSEKGHGDNVKCFFCDGGLRNWEPGDDPWQEHAKWFPRCEFLIQSRGQEYISNIQDAHFQMGDTMGGSQTSTGRDIGSRNDVVGGLGVSSAMLSPVVQTVLQMGFEASLVESLVQSKYLLTGQYYTSVSDLVTDVLQAEEEDRHRGPNSREPEMRQGSSAGNVRQQTPVRQKVKDPSSEELLRQLQEERTCKVCMDKMVSIVFIPCGHLVVCGDCAASLRHCPICRAVIRGSVRAFMS